MEFNTKNPDWIVKNVGDLQTAVEMNDVIDALKKNADVLQNLINKVYPNILLKTNAQLISKAINELHDSISTIVGFNISTKTLTDSQVYYFPAMSKGEAFIIKIIDSDYIPAPSGAVWLGGYGGVLAGDGTLVICLTNSLGGSFSEVGHQFVVINQGKNSEILFVDELPDENLARTGVIYVLNSNNAMYVWDQQLGDYVLVGDVVPGTLISITEFIDENNNVVVPESNKIYFDIGTEIYYRWDGSGYVPLITLASEAKWGDITGDIQDQEDLIALVDKKLDKPLSDGTFLVKKNGLAVTYVSADGFGQNIANTNLTTTGERTFTQGFTYTHATEGKIYYVTGLPNKNFDESFRKFRVQDANGQQAVVDKEELYDTIPYRSISGSTVPPTIAELNAFGTDRVDFPNLNRVYLKMTGWKYFEVFDVV